MKLYTEEQVKEAIKMARSSTNIFATPFLYEQYEILDSLTSIELPSDEEIEEESLCCAWGSLPFELGAEWVLEQIKQQADGHTR